MGHFARPGFVAAISGASVVALAGCGGRGVGTNASNAANASPPLAATNASNPMAGMPAPTSPNPMTPAAGPTRYCGTIMNTTVGQSVQGEIDVNPGPGFSGTIILNGSTLSGGAGPFQGTMAGGQCSGVSNSGGMTFTGACPAGGQFSGTYAIQGQAGTFQMSSSACQ